MNRKDYNSDPRYAKVLEQMDLLGIMDISTTRQSKNGTIVWKLPIKDQDSGILIEVASFASGYVRNQGKSTRSNFQLNKRCESEPDYYEVERDGLSPLYRKFTTRTCKLIPIEIDRLLKQWIPVNTIIREEIREAIIQMKMKAMDKAYNKGHEAGVEAGLDYKQNTNKDG